MLADWIPSILMLVLFALETPISFAIAISALSFFLLDGEVPLNIMVQKMVSATDSYPLLAIPFFVLAGAIMNKAGITKRLPEVFLNGSLEHRLPGNLNISVAFVEGESLLMALKDIAVSSGSACTSASLEPSYVLRALGIGEELAHTSIRFGIGRFNTEAEIDYTIDVVVSAVERLRELSPLWEMHQDGVDLDSVQWAAH